MKLHQTIKWGSNIIKKLLITFAVLLLFSACKSGNEGRIFQSKLQISLVDSNATFGTSALFYNLKKSSESQIIFGHHHSTAYGIGWSGDKERSDVKDVTGVYPGLIGWDFADINEGQPVTRDQLKQLVPDAYDKGIINIFAWHLHNIVTDSSFYDTTIVVKHILPGGSHHKKYIKELDNVAQFTKHIVGRDGKVVPIIFRPFHEFDGSWFWWGKNFCTREEFKALWRFTVHYLRDVRNVKNILYAFSPDRNFYSEDGFLESYPGDDYVDVVGMDNYWDFKPEGDGLDAITNKLKILTSVSKKRNKIAAFTETGSEKIPNSKWWTDELLKVMDHDSINVAFVMVWRNAHLNHFYVPHSGHPSSENFIEFKNNAKMIFADELPKLFNIDIKLSN